ncbi:DEAD/DEAH box helicase family protein [Evansella sp. AB-P1]|uniref:DNA repair helicase XPB n=1 Tax=Evansella sp. AB-P1 TaxID=3037653 RepID=UPI00241E1E6B|nr:DNA repair helicase XPB [Evansella sp. AB-P1]MDG5788317.1 DEAD/DEAH box helicase family protein [Evansella sp. AB-P1]
MTSVKEMPLLIQNNGVIFFRSTHPEAKIVQPFLSEFAQLKKTPSSLHMYELSPFSFWYAREQGISLNEIKEFLETFSGIRLPDRFSIQLEEWEGKNGKFQLINHKEFGPCLTSSQEGLMKELFQKDRKNYSIYKNGDREYTPISLAERGLIKQQLMDKGYSVIDCLGYETGKSLSISLQRNVSLRPYQKEAVSSFIQQKGVNEGNGFIILPCGSGKTVVGLGVLEQIKEETLILVPNDTSLQQWYEELLEKTTLNKSQVGRYTREKKEVKEVTITTYQMLTYQGNSDSKFPHFSLFHKRSWGLVIYDEVHLLPAPLFRLTSKLQGKRRLGLTATFVREDGKEGDIYSLIGPKRYEVGISLLEQNNWIARPICKEIKTPFNEKQWAHFLSLSKRERFRYASENKGKINVVDKLLHDHKGDSIIIIGQYLDQLNIIANTFSLPLLTGKTSKKERQEMYTQFKEGKQKVLVLSKIANMAVDLPDANVAIQVSGTYGSRQEEAQRIGRLLRPKKNNESVYFYTIVTPMTKEEEVASHRQLFMVEQGYSYSWEEWSTCSLII